MLASYLCFRFQVYEWIMCTNFIFCVAQWHNFWPQTWLQVLQLYGGIQRRCSAWRIRRQWFTSSCEQRSHLNNTSKMKMPVTCNRSSFCYSINWLKSKYRLPFLKFRTGLLHLYWLVLTGLFHTRNPVAFIQCTDFILSRNLCESRGFYVCLLRLNSV